MALINETVGGGRIIQEEEPAAPNLLEMEKDLWVNLFA
jgi:hypothetical protein